LINPYLPTIAAAGIKQEVKRQETGVGEESQRPL